MNKRVFLGIPVLPSNARAFSQLQSHLNAHMIKWVPEENYHVTVSFFGSMRDDRIPELSRILENITRQHTSFRLVYEKIILAPPTGKKRMIWAVYKKSNAFNTLVEDIEKQVGKIHDLPDFRKSHNPIPHITLARFDSLLLPAMANLQHHSITADHAVLYESHTSPYGPTYSRPTSFPLL